MSLSDRVIKVYTFLNANLALAQNTLLFTFTPTQPIMIQRFTVVGDAAVGLLEPTRLKLRLIPATTGVPEDLGTDRLVSAVKARGLGIYKDITTPGGLRVDAGDAVGFAIEVTSGGVSSADVSIHYWGLPFAGVEIADWSKSA